MEAITYLITISSSFINSPYNLYLAYLLPTVHLSNTALYLNQFTLLGGSRQQAEGFALKQFYDPLFLPRTTTYTARVGTPADA